MKFSELKTDETMEEDGVWIQYADDFWVKLARLDNKKATKLLRKLEKPYKRQIRLGTISDDVQKKNIIQLVARTVLLEWRGLENDDGSPDLFSKERAEERLSESKDFLKDVLQMSQEPANFRKELQEDAEGNS
ncbi:MAG: hypothetical protein FVQ84_08555 [Planctomycetes bacterium]|nr:hypothetical protein [Planctomycetota bacterium]